MKLTNKEMAAVVDFFKKYMVARKHWEGLANEAYERQETLGYVIWQSYYETKNEAMEELLDILGDCRTIKDELWRYTIGLQPQAFVDYILRHRKEMDADRQQRAKERAILAGNSKPASTQQILKRYGRRNENGGLLW